MLLKGKRARIVDSAERKKDNLCSGKNISREITVAPKSENHCMFFFCSS